MREVVFGEEFAVVQPTALLADCIAGAIGVLEAAVAGSGARVLGRPRCTLGNHTELRPTLMIEEAATGKSTLVVEFRTESTGRYILGPKRLAYGQMGVPELWYADPQCRRIAVMLLDRTSTRFHWPATVFHSDEVLSPVEASLAPTTVNELLTHWPRNHVHHLPVDATWPSDM